MFTFTSVIFFGLLDLIISAILVGIGIVVLAVIIFLVSQLIKAMLCANKAEEPDNKQRDKNTFLYEEYYIKEKLIMIDWKRVGIGFGILLAFSYIIRLFGGNIFIDLAFTIIIITLTVFFMFGDKNTNVKKEDEES